MNIHELAVVVARKEKGKKQVTIAQVKEIIKIICVELYANEKLAKNMINNGKRNFKNVVEQQGI